LDIVSNEKSADKTELIDTDSKSAVLQSTTNEQPEQEQVLIEPRNTRELQIDQAEIIAEHDQPTQESALKPAELEHATDEVYAVDISEVIATGSSSVEEIEEVLVVKEEVAREMPKEEIEEIEEANEKHTEEEVNYYLHSPEQRNHLVGFHEN
jgi:hypothetical protein